MMRNGLFALALATCGALVACGGGGGDDDDPELRTEIRCAATDGSTCGESRWAIPAELRCAEGYREVSSCPDTGILGTCAFDGATSEGEIHVYDAGSLSSTEAICENMGGTWTTVPALRE